MIFIKHRGEDYDMKRSTALENLLQAARDKGYEPKQCRIEELTDPGDGDRFWKLTPPNNDPPLREYFDPTQLD